MTGFDTISDVWGIPTDRLGTVAPEEQSTLAAANGMDSCPIVAISGAVRSDVVPATVKGVVNPSYWEVLVRLQTGARSGIYAVKRGKIASLEDSARLWKMLKMPIESVVDLATMYMYRTPQRIVELVRALQGEDEDPDMQRKIVEYVMTSKYGAYEIFREEPIRFRCRKTGVLDYVRSRRALQQVEWGHRGAVAKGLLLSEWRFCVAVLQLHLVLT